MMYQVASAYEPCLYACFDGLAFMDSNLNPQQREAVEATTNKHVQVLAGPGTGKTKTLVNRVIRLIESGVPPQEILVLTFTNRAVDIFRQRLELVAGAVQGAHLVNIHTFHSYCQHLLTTIGPRAGFLDKYSIADDQDQEYFYSEAVHSLGHAPLKQADHVLLGQYKRSLIESEELVVEELDSDPSMAETNKSLPQLCQERMEQDPSIPSSIVSIINAYNQLLQKAHMIDYTDILLAGKYLIDEHAYLLPKLQAVLVDEFQDSSPFQWALVRNIAQRQSAHITVVGDPDQSIFGFQGADPTIFHAMYVQYEGDITRVVLRENFRSSRQIVAASTALIRASPDHYLGDMDMPFGTFDTTTLPELCERATLAAELQWIASEAQHLLQSDPSLRPCDIGVLTRTNYTRDLVADMLRKEGYAVSVYGTPSILRNINVSPLYTFLKFARNCDDMYFQRLARVAPLGKVGKLISDVKLRQLRTSARRANMSLWELFCDLQNLQLHGGGRLTKLAEYNTFAQSLKEGVDSLRNDPYCVRTLIDSLKHVEPHLVRKGRTRDRYQSQFYSMIEEISSKVDPGADESLAAALIRHSRIQDLRANPNEIVASTIHGAKGLEWRAVFVCDATTKQFRARDPEDRRVLYVGMTRARERLYVSYNTEVPMWGQEGAPKQLTTLLDDPAILCKFSRSATRESVWMQRYKGLNSVRLKFPKVFPRLH